MFGEWKAKCSPVLNGAFQRQRSRTTHCTEASADHSVKPLVRSDLRVWLIPVLDSGESRAFHPCCSRVPMQF